MKLAIGQKFTDTYNNVYEIDDMNDNHVYLVRKDTPSVIHHCSFTIRDFLIEVAAGYYTLDAKQAVTVDIKEWLTSPQVKKDDTNENS